MIGHHIWQLSISLRITIIIYTVMNSAQRVLEVSLTIILVSAKLHAKTHIQSVFIHLKKIYIFRLYFKKSITIVIDSSYRSKISPLPPKKFRIPYILFELLKKKKLPEGPLTIHGTRGYQEDQTRCIQVCIQILEHL